MNIPIWVIISRSVFSISVLIKRHLAVSGCAIVMAHPALEHTPVSIHLNIDGFDREVVTRTEG